MRMYWFDGTDRNTGRRHIYVGLMFGRRKVEYFREVGPAITSWTRHNCNVRHDWEWTIGNDHALPER